MKRIDRSKGVQEQGKGGAALKAVTACLLLFFVFAVFPIAGANAKEIHPKEPGIYVKTGQGLKRILPNIVFDEKGVIFLESNNPQRFLLKDVEHFVIFGPQDMDHLTMNPLLFLQQSPVGKARYIFGKDLPVDVKKTGKDLYTVKPKDLLGRGYFCLWINDTAWDFVIE
jgi:hypothetical protein